MTFLRRLVFVALVSGLAAAQTNAPQENVASQNLSDQLRKLQQTMVEQQQAIAGQQKQIHEEQMELDRLREQLNAQLQAASAQHANSGPRLIDASLNTTESSATARPEARPRPQEMEHKESPLSFRIGGADFTPGGFMDFTSIFRTTNEGTLGTNFFNIPFNNVIAGHLTESRFTAQNSRISLKAHSMFGKNDVTGYVELDFLGNDGANIEVTSNSHTFRQRLYFLDLKRDKWEVLAGQAWSWLTPNRVGVSSITSDVFYSLNEDFNYQVGLTWTRAPQFRVIYHSNENWATGVAVENPEQFGGQGEITYPAAFNAQLAGQIDSAAGGTSVPNLHPDIIPKITYDKTMASGKHVHAEVAGLLSSVKITDLPEGPSNPLGLFVKHTKTGGGVSAAVNLEFLKNIRFVANGFWSDGGGRYIFGMAPDLVLAPTNAPGTTCVLTGTTTKTATGCDVALSLVHSGSGIAGFEAQVTPHTTLFGYYGGMYVQRNSYLDITSTATTQPFIGFGGPGSANNNNRSIQEPTLGWVQTFWKNPQYGALQFITQTSYLTRSPWFVAAGAPKNAHLTMVWLDLRYVLP